MTQRLPTPGGDDGDWGDILNAYLEVSHNSDGTLANNTVGTNQLQNNAVTNAQLDSTTQTKLAAASTAVQSVNGKTGASVTLAASDVSAVASSQLGVSGGIATLTGTTLTSSQLPASVDTGSFVYGAAVQGTRSNLLLRDVLSVKDYNAVADYATVADSAITTGTNQLSSATAQYKAGQSVVVIGAGTSGANLQTTISSVNSGTNVATLAVNASTTVASGATVSYFTDNAAALNSAITAAAALPNGATVLIPRGNYGYSSQVTLASNVTLRGEGSLTVLYPNFASAAYAGAIINNLVSGNTNVTLRDFQLSRAGNNVQHGILLNGITNLLVQGLEIVGVPSVVSGALAISGILPGGSGASNLLSKDVRVIGCRFVSANNFGVQISWVTNGTVTGCVFEDCYREAVGVEPQSGCTATNISISGNSFTTGTIPSGGSATGVIVITTSSGGTLAGVSATGNTITNTNAVTSNTNSGIQVLGANPGSLVSLSNNVVVGTNGPGIVVGNASVATDGVMVTSNIIYNCNAGQNATTGGPGIQLRQALRSVVMGNYINGTHHTASIYESQSGTTRNIIIGNQLCDTTPWVLLAGSSSLAAQNLGKTIGSGSRLANSATTYTMAATDTLVAQTSTASAITITMPAAASGPVGQIYVVADESQGAGTHNITVQRAGSDTFTDSTTSKVISTNGGVLRFYSTGTAWQQV